MFISKLEALIPIMDENIVKRLRKYFDNEINQNENNILVLLFQIYLIFERGDNNKKAEIMNEINSILN